MTEHDDVVFVRHMLDAAQEAINISKAINRSDLAPMGLETLALTRLLEIIGEAARRLSPRFRELHPEIEWKLIVGTRDRLIHGYDRVDLDRLWSICTKDLPDLVVKLKALVNPG